jgi:hypothetical protein
MGIGSLPVQLGVAARRAPAGVMAGAAGRGGGCCCWTGGAPACRGVGAAGRAGPADGRFLARPASAGHLVQRLRRAAVRAGMMVSAFALRAAPGGCVMMATAPLAAGADLPPGLVQAALGAVVVLTTSTLNRVMVVELALPALLPGLLVACTTWCRWRGRAWATARTWAGAARPGSSAAWRCWRRAAGWRAGHGLDGQRPGGRHRAGRAGLPADRPGRQCQRHLAAGAAGQAGGARAAPAPPRWSG